MRPININAPLFVFSAFGLVLVLWGFNWVVLKLALDHITPFWSTVLRFAIGAGFVLLIHLFKRNLYIPTIKDLPLIFTVGALQMGLYFCFAIEALKFVPPGRAAIVAYTTPLWIVPLAVFVFHEHFNRWKLFGFILGVSGVLILFNPLEVDWHDKNVLIGHVLLLLASLCSAFAILHIRYGEWHASTSKLFFWQLLVGLIVSLLFAFFFEPWPQIKWNLDFAWELIYMTFISLLLCYWIIIWVTTKLPTITTSLGSLAVPILGLLFSAWLLGEQITTSLLIALGLIIGGLVLVTVSNK